MAKEGGTAAVQVDSRSLRNGDEVEDVDLSQDQIFEVLSNERRRMVLHYLTRSDTEDRVPLRVLVDHVAAWENDIMIEELRSDDRKCVYSALRQSHLPKLNREGLIEFDPTNSEVALREPAEEVETYLQYAPGNDIAWSQLYLVLSLIGVAVVGFTWIGITAVAGVSGWTLALGIVLVFLVVSAFHLAQTRKNRIGTSYEVEQPIRR